MAKWTLPNKFQRGQGQNVYRQVMMGYVPFMAQSKIEQFNKASDYIFSENPGTSVFSEGDDSYLEWGPSIGGTEAFDFLKKDSSVNAGEGREGYVTDVLLPYVHWLYGGNVASWLVNLRSLHPQAGAKQPFAFRASRTWDAMSKTIGKMTVAGTGSKGGVIKPNNWRESAETFGGLDKFDNLHELLEKLSVNDRNLTQPESMLDYPTSDGPKDLWRELPFKAPLSKLVGGTGKTFGSNPAWLPSRGFLAQASKAFQESILDDISEIYADAESDPTINKNPVTEGVNYGGESPEELGIGILCNKLTEDGEAARIGIDNPELMRKWGERDLNKNQQFLKGSKVGALPKEYARTFSKGNRQNVDISTQGAEGDLVYTLRSLDNAAGRDLKKLVQLEQNSSVGVEVTAASLYKKGGYSAAFAAEGFKTTVPDVKTAVKIITDFNQLQADMINNAFEELGFETRDIAQRMNIVAGQLEMEGVKEGKDGFGANVDMGATFQARQTAVRLIDAMMMGGEGTGFEFVAPFYVAKQNKEYLVSWNWVIDQGGATFSDPVTLAMRDGNRFFIDLVGSAMFANDTKWQDYRDNRLRQQMMDEYYRNAAIDKLLGKQLEGDMLLRELTSIAPHVEVGVKGNRDIIAALNAKIMANIKENMGGSGDFMANMKKKMSAGEQHWKTRSEANKWEGNRKFFEDNSPWANQTSSGRQEVLQWTLPFIRAGRAGAGGAAGRKYKEVGA
jgi:hypothetical protein